MALQSSFLWGYVFSSIVGGALADRYGGKRVMACGVAVWSAATALTPWAANHSTAMLLAARALFGLAEGVAMPSMNTLLSRCHLWFFTYIINIFLFVGFIMRILIIITFLDYQSSHHAYIFVGFITTLILIISSCLYFALIEGYKIE